MPGWVPTREELIEMLADADTRRRLSGGAAAKKKKKAASKRKSPRRSKRVAKKNKSASTKKKAASKKKSKKSPKKKPKRKSPKKSKKKKSASKRKSKKKGLCKRGKVKNAKGRCVKKNRRSRKPCTPSRSGLARSRRNSAGLLSSKRRCTIDRLSTVNRGACRAKTRAGINRAVWEGRCAATPSGLTRTDLMVSKSGKIVSKKKSAQAKKTLRNHAHEAWAKKWKANTLKIKKTKGHTHITEEGEIDPVFIIKPKRSRRSRRKQGKSPRKAPATAKRPARKPRKSTSATKAKNGRPTRRRRSPVRLGFAGM